MRLGSEFATPARAVFGDAGVVPADDKQAGGMSLAVGAQATWPCMPEAPPTTRSSDRADQKTSAQTIRLRSCQP